MGNKTKIEWADETVNVFVVRDNKTMKRAGWICEKVSAGCKNCYAEKLNMSNRFNGNGLRFSRQSIEKMAPFERYEVVFDEANCYKWANRIKPKRIFVNSMTDTFGSFVRDKWLMSLFNHMTGAPKLTFLILTKRAKRAAVFINGWLKKSGLDSLPPNIWIGVSVEDQGTAKSRIPELLKIPAHVRFLSCEPLLGPVVLEPQWLKGLHWVIVGGESGDRGKARFTKPAWVRFSRDQCKGINFFFKQWGAWVPMSQTAAREPGNVTTLNGERFGYFHDKRAAGRLLDGVEYSEIPNDPTPKQRPLF